MIVVVEMIRRASLAGLRRFQSGAVHDEDVRPAVVVVVEDGNACACSLNDVFLAVHAAEYLRHCQTGLVGDIDEVGDGLFWRWGELRGLLGKHDICQKQEKEKSRCPGGELPERTMTWDRRHADFGY